MAHSNPPREETVAPIESITKFIELVDNYFGTDETYKCNNGIICSMLYSAMTDT